MKAEDNEFPYVTMAEQASDVATPAAGLWRLYPKSDGLYLIDDAGTVVGPLGAGGGGGGGSSVKDRRWSIPAGSTSIDEFNDDSLDAAWVRVDGAGAASGNLAWTEGADVLSAYNIGGDTTDKLHALLRPLSGAGGAMSVGDAFVAGFRLMVPAATNFAFIGLALTDGVTFGSGNQVFAQYGATTGDSSNTKVAPWTGFDTGGTSVGGLPASLTSRDMFMRLVMTAANTWRADYSPDGVSWWKGTATLSKTLTPTHVGFVDTSYGTSTAHIASWEFLRRYSGIS